MKKIVLYCGRVPAANAPRCTVAEGLLYKPLIFSRSYLHRQVSPPETPSSERRNYLGEKWPMKSA